jgi:hypothetical protein
MASSDHMAVTLQVAGDGIVGQTDVIRVLEFGSELGDGPVAGEAAKAEPGEDVPADQPPGQGDLGFGERAEGAVVSGAAGVRAVSEFADEFEGTLKREDVMKAMVADMEVVPTEKADPLLYGEDHLREPGVSWPTVTHRLASSIISPFLSAHPFTFLAFSRVVDFKNGGQEWHPQGQPEKVRVHDFMDKELGKAIPYGVYDVTNNQGWVNVGIDHDTAYFAAASIRRWWQEMGAERFPHAEQLLLTADGGGSNSSRTRLWKVALQELADDIGLPWTVSHFPPGTSKWNKVEHRLFSFMSLNWRGKPLESHEVIINLIAATTTSTGLKVYAQLDKHPYPTKIEVTDEQLAAVNITPHSFHGDWNYTISPSIIES